MLRSHLKFHFCRYVFRFVQMFYKYCLHISQWNVGYEAEYFHENAKSTKQSLKHTFNENTKTCFMMVKYLGNSNAYVQKITAKWKFWTAFVSLIF